MEYWQVGLETVRGKGNSLRSGKSQGISVTLNEEKFGKVD